MAGAGLIKIISLTSSLVYAQTGLELSTGKHCKRVSHARILSNRRAREGEAERRFDGYTTNDIWPAGGWVCLFYIWLDLQTRLRDTALIRDLT